MFKRLKYMPYAQAGIEDNYPYDVPEVILWSYQTRVVKVVRGHWISCSGLYSMTTRKHISAFMREFFPELGFQLIKKLAGTGMEYDTETGEVREISCKWYD